jgi:hypothetical protein
MGHSLLKWPDCRASLLNLVECEKCSCAIYTVTSQLIASAERVGPRQLRWLFGMEKWGGWTGH